MKYMIVFFFWWKQYKTKNKSLNATVAVKKPEAALITVQEPEAAAITVQEPEAAAITVQEPEAAAITVKEPEAAVTSSRCNVPEDVDGDNNGSDDTGM